MFTLLRGSNRRDRIYEYRVKYAVITLSCAVRSMKTAGNFINECGTRTAPWFEEKTRSLLSFFSASKLKILRIFILLLLLLRRKKEKKKIGSNERRTRHGYATGCSRVYSSCTRIWLHQRVYAERVSIRDFTGSKVPSGSIIIIPLCCLSLQWGATLFERRRRNEATLWLTIPSCNGQRPGGSATRRQDLFRSACVRATRITRDLRAYAP